MHTETPSSPDPAPEWDPIEVRDRIRKVRSLDNHPAELILGRTEAEALRTFLQAEYGDDPAPLGTTYYLGLKVRLADEPSRLEVTGSKQPRGVAGELAPLWSDTPDESHRAA